jgi:hypothetical protein
MDINKYELPKETEEEIWSNAMFIFDTSSLLNIYKLSEDACDDFFESIIKSLKNRIWMPYYVFFEFNKNRYKPINETISLYNDLNKNLISIEEQFIQIQNKTKLKDKHPILRNQLIEKYKPLISELKSEFEKEINEQIKVIETIKDKDKDTIFKRIQENFKIGDPFSYSQIAEIIKEGEFRYKHSLPPGYKDVDKKGFQRFADLIIWKEILKYSSIQKKPIVLITDDNKEDWWVLDSKNKPIKPREELIDEIIEKSDVQFWMYNTSTFMEASINLSIIEFKNSTLEEIKFISLMNPDDIVYEKIKLSSSSGSGNNEQHRIERLTCVVDYISSKHNNSKIFELHDHKGDLTVYWTSKPTSEEINTVEEAWELENELKENVEHIIL